MQILLVEGAGKSQAFILQVREVQRLGGAVDPLYNDATWFTVEFNRHTEVDFIGGLKR
jgi:hypothetical protein